MCFRDEGREGWKSNKLDCGNIQISHSHSYVTRPSTGESVRAYEKSQLINLLATVPRHIHRQIKNKNTNWSKCPLRFTNCLTLLCSSYILESVCNRKRYYKKSHLIYRLAICSGWKPGAGSPLYPCGPANTPLGSTQRPKSVRLNSCLPPNPSSPPRESNIWL